MGKVKEFIADVAELFGAPFEAEEDFDDATRLAQLVWDLNDAATDYGRRLRISGDTITLERVSGDDSIVFEPPLTQEDLEAPPVGPRTDPWKN